jgi:glutathione S-transferase
MKLYSNRFAPSPRRVRIYCAEKGLPLALVEVDIATGQTQGPEYLAVNPLGELPTLVLDDGTRLTESVAICRHLEELHPDPPLFGRSAAERYEVNRWIDRLLVRMYVPTTHVFRHTHAFWKDRVQQVPAWGEQQRAAVLAEYAALDARLADREHVAGGGFSIADIVAFTTLEFGKPSNLRAGPEHPHLLRWYEVVKARPSAKA